jgi:hypothetical protein
MQVTSFLLNSYSVVFSVHILLWLTVYIAMAAMYWRRADFGANQILFPEDTKTVLANSENADEEISVWVRAQAVAFGSDAIILRFTQVLMKLWQDIPQGFNSVRFRKGQNQYRVADGLYHDVFYMYMVV